jgi:hypothetical protein
LPLDHSASLFFNHHPIEPIIVDEVNSLLLTFYNFFFSFFFFVVLE